MERIEIDFNRLESDLAKNGVFCDCLDYADHTQTKVEVLLKDGSVTKDKEVELVARMHGLKVESSKLFVEKLSVDDDGFENYTCWSYSLVK